MIQLRFLFDLTFLVRNPNFSLVTFFLRLRVPTYFNYLLLFLSFLALSWSFSWLFKSRSPVDDYFFFFNFPVSGESFFTFFFFNTLLIFYPLYFFCVCVISFFSSPSPLVFFFSLLSPVDNVDNVKDGWIS